MLKWALGFAVVLVLAGCGKAERVPMATERVLASHTVDVAVGGAFLSDVVYAEVNSAWLRSYQEEFRAELFRQGVVKWDGRFDCDDFAGYYVALAQTRHFLANWHSRTPAQRLALGVYWYRQDGGQSHAIVGALTERGLIFVDPQSGAEVALTRSEREGPWLKVF